MQNDIVADNIVCLITVIIRPPLWPTFKTFVISLISHPGRSWSRELVFSVLFHLPFLICFQALSKKKNWGAKFRQSDVKKRSNIGEVSFEENQKTKDSAWLTKNPGAGICQGSQYRPFCERIEIFSAVFRSKVFSDMEDPVTDVTFVPMQKSI